MPTLTPSPGTLVLSLEPYMASGLPPGMRRRSRRGEEPRPEIIRIATPVFFFTSCDFLESSFSGSLIQANRIYTLYWSRQLKFATSNGIRNIQVPMKSNACQNFKPQEKRHVRIHDNLYNILGMSKWQICVCIHVYDELRTPNHIYSLLV